MKRLLCLCAVLLFCLPACSANRKYQTGFFDLFDTYMDFTAYASSQAEFDEYAQIVRQELLRLHQLFDVYNTYPQYSNLKTLNDAAGTAPIAVDGDLLALLEFAKKAYAETGGVVNCALGPVLRVWHDYREAARSGTPAVPSYEELAAAAVNCSMDDVQLDCAQGTAFLTKPGMALDVGAIAKGYAASKAMALAKEAGMTSGLLNAGGNVCAVGRPEDGRAAWSVGLRDPSLSQEAAQTLWDVLSVSDLSVVTSGDYQRFYTVDGTVYHHIIDPHTLYPAREVRAVSVIHADGAIADLLSTAAFILPIDEAFALVERMDGQAVWLLSDGSTWETGGYAALQDKSAQ